MGESEEVGDGEEQNKRGGKRAGGESKRCKRGALWSGLVWFGLVFPCDGFGVGACSSIAKEKFHSDQSLFKICNFFKRLLTIPSYSD